MIENVIIIGGGPAGLSAAIYLARANLNPLVFAGSPPGGQLTLTSEVENYPGFESILGSELIEKMRKQAIKFGARIVDENVLEINLNKSEIRNPKSETNSKRFENSNLKNSKIVSSFDIRASKLFLTKSIIIATGAKALWLNLPSETRLRGRGVSACATCDGFFFREKTVAVIGGGDTALEEALTLTKFAKKVYIIHRRDFFKASKIMQERVKENPKIEIIWNASVEEIIGEKHVEGIKIKSDRIGQSQIESDKISKNKTDYIQLNPISSNSISQVLKVDGVFVAIGHKPDTDLFKGKVDLDEKGYILVKPVESVKSVKSVTDSTDFNRFNYQRMTSVPGVFAAGDCADPYYKQAITSAGTGVEAALEVERYLESI